MSETNLDIVMNFEGGGRFLGKVLAGTPTVMCEQPKVPGTVHWDKSLPPDVWPWGTYGKNACHELRWTELGMCSNEHLKAIMTTMAYIPDEYRTGIMAILNRRDAGITYAPKMTTTLDEYRSIPVAGYRNHGKGS